MSTIIAVCPYCRSGGVRAPQSALGASANCPKCGSSFTVMPSEGAPGWAASAGPPKAPPQPAAHLQPPTPPSPSKGLEETKPVAAMSDVTEPSPVEELQKPKKTEESQKPKKKKKKRRSSASSASAAAPARSPAPSPEPKPAVESVPAFTTLSPTETESEDAETATDFGLIVAISAVALVGVAVLATLFPFGRFIALALAALGLFGGIVSLGAEGKARSAGGLAIGLHSLVLFVLLLFPSWLHLDSWRSSIIPDAPPAPQAFSHGKHTIDVADWVDASSASWQFKDVRVTLRSVTLGPIDVLDPKGLKRQSKQNYLQLNLLVKNIGVERPIDLSGWSSGKNLEQVRLIDSQDRPIGPAAIEEGWSPDLPASKPLEKLFPDKHSEVRLLFSAPLSRVEFLRLTLPGKPFGFEEVIKFQIDSGFVILTDPKRK